MSAHANCFIGPLKFYPITSQKAGLMRGSIDFLGEREKNNSPRAWGLVAARRLGQDGGRGGGRRETQ